MHHFPSFFPNFGVKFKIYLLKMKIKVQTILFSLFLWVGIMFASHAMAQCSVCASNVSSSVKSAQKKAGLGINDGIVALLVMPYAIVGIVGALWYANSRKKKRMINDQ